MFIRAVMTFSEADIQTAVTALELAESLANAQLNMYRQPMTLSSVVTGIGKAGFGLGLSVGRAGIGAVGSFFRAVSGSTPSPAEEQKQEVVAEGNVMPNGELRALVTKAEANLLCAVLMLLQESVFGFMKAGLKLRRGYRSYSHAWSEMKKVLESQYVDKFDRHTVGGVQFGIGTLNLSLAFMPRKVLSVISILGIKCDKQLGDSLLEKSLEGHGVRSPLASIMLLGVDNILISFTPQLYGSTTLPHARHIIETSLKLYPTSALHLYMSGRIARLIDREDDLVSSTAHLKRCLEAQSDWKELQNLCRYELGLNAAFRLEWVEAADYMKGLYEASYWSKAFYAYFRAVCLDMAAFVEEFEAKKGRKSDDDDTWKTRVQEYRKEAHDLYTRVPDLVLRKFGGRTIGVEQYATRKCKIFAKDAYTRTLLPALELIAIWNGYGFMKREKLERCVEWVESVLGEVKSFGEDTPSPSPPTSSAPTSAPATPPRKWTP
ncbi:tetratricopeptide repeat domain 39A, partial [Quaeritorhiza haematococci]